MASNGSSNGSESILVMYKVVNSETDPEGDHYNAFHMPRSNGLTLAAVKQRCSALHALNHIGPDGYHWRVCVEDKPTSGSSSKSTFSWWDIQDDKAGLPVKNATPSELRKLFTGTSHHSGGGGGHEASPKSAAKGALRGLGKAMSAVAGAVDVHHTEDDHGPRVSVIAFKLLDLVKMHDDFVRIHGGSSMAGHHHHVEPRAPKAAPRAARPAAAASPAPQRPAPVPSRATPQQGRAPARTPAPPPRVPQTATRASVPVRAPSRQQQKEASLMDFDSPKSSGRKTANLMHAQSLPSAFDNETRAERLKREYAQNGITQNRVWDEVDQRWVAVEASGSEVKQASTSAPPSAMNESGSGAKVVGITLDASNAIGKSVTVQAAVHKRVNDMKASQEKALAEVREREEKKKKEEEEEDAARKLLEPKIKVWSEEHGKKKQLRALLGTLHTILWPGADWKPIGLGDLLDDGKVKRAFHKASRVVHPDKTHHLPPDQRFLAKRIFDALSQAKTEFDEGK